ncbi:hypothetical protein [Massilia sp. TWP1-3-3]|uniref:hypothetical protein n=1 Tax=Massilia sp. TWP1-3-3 TaxID=2804573 RepID=UPI003CEDFADD
MNAKQFLMSLSCVAVLAACASTTPAPPAPPAMATLLQQADSALKLGQSAAAVATLKIATRAYPLEKTAWLRIAQVSFDCHEYGETITHAKKVLELDPDNVVATSLLAVSGLRVSSKALADLTVKNRIVTGDVRAEAQNLATILRTSVGGEIIPAVEKTERSKPRAGRPQKTIAASQGPRSTTEEVLDLLNQPNVPVKK